MIVRLNVMEKIVVFVMSIYYMTHCFFLFLFVLMDPKLLFSVLSLAQYVRARGTLRSAMRSTSCLLLSLERSPFWLPRVPGHKPYLGRV